MFPSLPSSRLGQITAVGIAASIGILSLTLAYKQLTAVAGNSDDPRQLWNSDDSENDDNNSSEVITTELLDLESTSLMLMIPSISTITFYQGETEKDFERVNNFLQQRMKEIVQLNPWLEGKLTKDSRTDRILLHHKVFDGALNSSTFQVVENDRLHDKMEYEAMAKEVSAFAVNDGNTIIEKTRRYTKGKGNKGDVMESEIALFRVTLIKLKNNQFALFFSLSHLIADGHTFYSLYGMLSHDVHAHQPSSSSTVGGGGVRSLIIDRDHQFSKKLDHAMGGNDTYDWAFSPGVMLNIISTMLFAKQPTVVMQNPINLEWIEQRKKDYQEHLSLTSHHCNFPSFISTNDILTSSHFQALQSDVGMMAMNFRNKFSELTDNHAGNYEALVAYQPEDFAFPYQIRQSLSKFRRIHHPRPLPGFFSSLRSKVGVISSWVTFYQEIILPSGRSDGDTVKHIYHIPYFKLDSGSAFSDVSVIFKPNRKDIALLSISRTFNSSSQNPKHFFV